MVKSVLIRFNEDTGDCVVMEPQEVIAQDFSTKAEVKIPKGARKITITNPLGMSVYNTDSLISDVRNEGYANGFTFGRNEVWNIVHDILFDPDYGTDFMIFGGWNSQSDIFNDTYEHVHEVVQRWRGLPKRFDIVKVQDKYGAIFELIKSTNSAEYLIDNTDKLDDFCIRYANFIKEMHSFADETVNLPQIKDMYLSQLCEIKDILPADLFERIKNVINDIPEEHRIIHGDVQVKNIMISDNDLVIIDMDTLSSGNPVFDFGGLFMTYVTFSIHEPDNTKRFLGFDASFAADLFYKTVKHYYENLSDEDYQKTLNVIKILGFVRFLFLIYGLQIGAPELKAVRIKDSVQALNQLV